MKESRFFIHFYLGSLLCLLNACSSSMYEFPVPLNGRLDLTAWDFMEQGSVPLDGEWEFYWKQLLTPQDFYGGSAPEPSRYIPVPASWTTQMDSTGQPYPAYGYATYRLRVKLPEKIPNLGIFIPKIWSATKVWANNQLIYEAGTIQTEYEGYENQIIEKLVEINAEDEQLDLVIQVANFDMFIGGMPKGFSLGYFDRLLEHTSLSYSWTLMWLGALLVMGLYHFILYLFRKERTSTLFFGVICLLVGIRLIIFGEHYLYEYLKEHAGWLNFAIQSKVYYAMTFSLVPIGLMYVKSLYPDEHFPMFQQIKVRWLRWLVLMLSKYIIAASVFVTGLYILFMLFTPPRVYMPTVLYYQGVIIIFGVYLVLMLVVRSIISIITQKQVESILQIVGILVMILAALNDGLHQLGFEIFGTFEILPFAFAVFLSLQFVIIAQRFSRAFGEVEDLSENLERKVIKRTAELTKKNEEIEKQNKKIETAYKHITDSVVYASRIQKAILMRPEEVIKNFQDGFIYLIPKDIVSGDFYWYAEVNSNGQVRNNLNEWKEGCIKILVAADCTGHGVPGAFMTVMGNDFLNEIVVEAGITNPEQILYELDKKVLSTLKKQNQGNNPNDGMDLTIIALNTGNHQMLFAGAKNPLYYVREGELHILPGSKSPIGSHQFHKNKVFESYPVVIQPGDVVYMFSDGFQDQFGGPSGRKYMKKRFRELLLSISHLPMSVQQTRLQEEFENWQGDWAQTDDVLVMGVKV